MKILDNKKYITQMALKIKFGIEFDHLSDKLIELFENDRI